MVKKKKTIIACAVILTAVLFFGVTQNIIKTPLTENKVIYSQRPDLYQIAKFSVLKIPVGNVTQTIGYAEGIARDKLYILDVDSYGRTLYRYEIGDGGAYEIGADDTIAMIIEQKYNEDTVWFYEDFCFVLGTSVNDFTEERISSLKTLNDWDKPYDDDKMYRLVYDGYKVSDKILKDLNIRKIYEKSEYSSGAFSCCGLAVDEYGRLLVAIYDECWHFVLINPDNTLNEKTCIEKINDVYAYQQQLHDFKQKSGWNTPYEGKAP